MSGGAAAVPVVRLHFSDPIGPDDIPLGLFLLTPTPERDAVLLTLRLNLEMVDGVREFPHESRAVFCARLRELFEDFIARLEPPAGVVH
jgi:hypothetical protein